MDPLGSTQGEWRSSSSRRHDLVLACSLLAFSLALWAAIAYALTLLVT